MKYRVLNTEKIRSCYTPYNKGYGEAGASFKRKALKTFNAQSGSPNEDINYNIFALRQRSRMMFMAAPVATSAIKTNRTNVIGIGLKPKSKVINSILKMTPEDAETWQKKTELEFSLWADDKRSCDALGINNFYAMQGMCFLSQLMSGDSFGLIKRYEPTTLRPYSLRVQIVEADLVSTPNDLKNAGLSILTDGLNTDNNNKIYDGVEVDEKGLIQAYHICNKYPFEGGKYSEETKWVRVPVLGEKSETYNILHVMESERPGQYRGVPYLAQIIEPLLQMRRYTDSELMAALVSTFFTAFIKTEDQDDDLWKDPTNENTVNTNESEHVIGTAEINYLKKGEDVVFGDPKHPNSGFDKFMLVLCQLCGAALEIPSEVLLKSFNSSYSASRAAILEAWKVFKTRREWFVDDFCQPVWELFMDEAVARGRIVAPGYFSNPIIRKAYLNTQWIGPSQGQLDPVKEVTAEILKNQNGFATREQSTVQLNGGDFDENIAQISRENQKLGEAGQISSITLNFNDGKDGGNNAQK